MSRFTDRDHPCPFCGGGSFSSGSLREQQTVSFAADDRGFLDQLSGVGKAEVKARVCLNCRHVDLFAPDFEISKRGPEETPPHKATAAL